MGYEVDATAEVANPYVTKKILDNSSGVVGRQSTVFLGDLLEGKFFRVGMLVAIEVENADASDVGCNP